MRDRRQGISIIPILVVLALFLASWTGCGTAVEAPALSVPGELGSLSLTAQVTGQEAVLGMRQLHGRDVGLVDGYIARYGADGDVATVWLGQTASASAAEELLERMTDRIAAGTPSFRNLEEILIDGQVVYSVLGGGERHYYYSSADNVIWLSTGASQPLELLEEALQALE